MVDSLGCFEADTTIRFYIIIETKAALPQAFTPNNDGENDFAFVRGWGIKEFLEVKIYNRWDNWCLKVMIYIKVGTVLTKVNPKQWIRTHIPYE
jgi:gliding motility-associated-like protein